MPNESLVTVVEGPKGKAEVYEVKQPDGSAAYELRFNGVTEIFRAMGEAYLMAGEKTGTKT